MGFGETGLSNFLESGLFWFILGVVLLLIELATPGFLAIFFAAGAWITAILLWIGVLSGSWLPLAVFLVISVSSLLLLRSRLQPIMRKKLGSDSDTELALDEFTGKTAMVVEPIETLKNTGKVEFKGTVWDARAASRIETGTAVTIVSRDNLILTVQPIKE